MSCSLAELIAANDDLEGPELAALRTALDTGHPYTLGGGAVPPTEVRRVVVPLTRPRPALACVCDNV